MRTRRIGHFFPAGTVDAFDIWLELIGTDATGKPVFWSGRVEDDGKGPVEPGAHFYRSYQLDGEGNPINKRNAWQTRSVLYVRMIPPGAADVAHYRVQIPEGRKRTDHASREAELSQIFALLHAVLLCRRAPSRAAGAGQPRPRQSPLLVRSREYSRRMFPGQSKTSIPDLPIVTLAEATSSSTSAIRDRDGRPVVEKKDRERWNDWGIGLLLQGDLKGAEYAFTRVTEAEPEYADGWLNVARALIQEGETDRPNPSLERALKIDASLGRIHFFKAHGPEGRWRL